MIYDSPYGRELYFIIMVFLSIYNTLYTWKKPKVDFSISSAFNNLMEEKASSKAIVSKIGASLLLFWLSVSNSPFYKMASIAKWE